MKKQFLLITLLFVLIIKGVSQTKGDIHNEVVGAIVNQFANASNVTFQQVYDFTATYASQHGYSIPSFQTLSSYKSSYLTGKTSCDQVFAALRDASVISSGLCTYYTQLKGYVEANADDHTSSINSLVDAFTSSSYYTSLSQGDQLTAQDFNDIAKKSFSFWYTNETNGRKSCRLVCILCIALVDASFSWCGPVCAAIMSAVARCCLCGTCGNVTCT